MIVDHDPRREGPAYPGIHPARPRSALHRFLGGSPVAVFVKLLLLSVLVGAGMAMLGLTPGRLFWSVYDTVRDLIDLGLVTFQDFGGWILAGAVVVVPLWFLSRLLSVSK
ncbi:hypothetical protein ASG40_12460 [Methylobacterium sp. Leaf399]|uniref:DUF6460 domain-containing protein n=1 Tax=unclassified Methylobacterium TaxID=2615210 RepID=UPI0006FC0970|nr:MULTISPECIES: DUF6460 domain-containing protein [unclassified Methylobacterium]KQP50428.1 hypothetical protein ASF39_12070 [Methylobacterium sp. Leaf108]KQT08676.1 hypothetical protein ASG40_12460 [Methylobacterium sp. Leaf399]KQT78674.1 hypothetical protein ASG59_05630 [Methylobacterium sp. Leaf466]